MDGLEWSVLEPLITAGKLPHFSALIERGVGASLQTMRPTFSPVLWTTLATGQAPVQHGIFNFGEVLADGRMGLPYTSNTRRVPAIWNLAGDGGRSTLSVAWWVSWPAEPVASARIVSSYAAQAQGAILWKAGVWEDGLPDMTWPPALQKSIAPALQAGAPQGPLRADYNKIFGVLPGDPNWGFPAERDALFRIVYHGDRTHLRIMREQLQAGLADLNLVYFGLPDVAGHFFWRYREPGAFAYPIPEAHLARLQSRIDLAYQTVDSWLGQLLLDVPEDTLVLVISDHGMHAANLDQPKHIQSGAHEDAPDGVLIAAGPGVAVRGLLPQAQRRLGHVLEVAPTLLHWIGLPLPEEWKGKPMLRLMTPAWRATHPVQRQSSLLDGFRPATPPRIPGEGLDAEFMASFRAIGYVEGEE